MGIEAEHPFVKKHHHFALLSQGFNTDILHVTQHYADILDLSIFYERGTFMSKKNYINIHKSINNLPKGRREGSKISKYG